MERNQLYFKFGTMLLTSATQIALHNFASHGQNRTDFFDPAIEDGFGGR
jgi:hypothetical protein